MLIAGIIAAACGAAEFGLTSLLFDAVFRKQWPKTAALLCIKLALYALCIPLMVWKFPGYAVPAGIGFGAGFTVYMLAYAAVKLIKEDG